MENAWGILRCVIDICRKLDEGKYLILKDPNKVRTPGQSAAPASRPISRSGQSAAPASRPLIASLCLLQQVIRVYSLPEGTFSSDEEEEEEEDEEDEEEEGELLVFYFLPLLLQFVYWEQQKLLYINNVLKNVLIFCLLKKHSYEILILL